MTSSSQVTIEECLERLQPLPNDHPTARKITILIGEMMALDCQPFSVVEDQGFVSLLNQLQPCYKIPSCKYFSATLIPELYAKCKETVEKILLIGPVMCFVLGWHMLPYLGYALWNLQWTCLLSEGFLTFKGLKHLKASFHP